jgi:hypothetical protein
MVIYREEGTLEKEFPGRDATQRMKGIGKLAKIFSIILHLGFLLIHAPQRCFYTILKRLRRLNSIVYGPREVGK